jgi:hypothetical protein
MFLNLIHFDIIIEIALIINFYNNVLEIALLMSKEILLFTNLIFIIINLFIKITILWNVALFSFIKYHYA